MFSSFFFSKVPWLVFIVGYYPKLLLNNMLSVGCSPIHYTLLQSEVNNKNTYFYSYTIHTI